MVCSKCGTQAAPDDKFCYVCGNPVNTGDENIPEPRLAKESANSATQTPKNSETGGKGKYIVGFLGFAVVCFALKYGTGAILTPQTTQTQQQRQNTSVQEKPNRDPSANTPMSVTQLKEFGESQANNSEMSQTHKDLAIAVVNAHILANDKPTKQQLLDEIKNTIEQVDGFPREVQRVTESLVSSRPSSSPARQPSQPPVQQEQHNTPQSSGKQQNQETPTQVLKMFHKNITNKNYRKAYNCLSDDFQNSMSYEGWSQGFRTTVSSNVSDIKVSSQTDMQSVLTYTLKAVDNPGGTHYFRGRAVLIKTSKGWKIDDITNETM